MQLAIVAAGFTAGEADQLRRAMAAWRRNGDLEKFEARLIGGMIERGYSAEFAQRLFSQIKGFGEYGFPDVACRELRAIGLRLGLAQVLRARGILLRAAEQSADGLLCAATARAVGARSWRRGAFRRRQPKRLGLHAGAPRGRQCSRSPRHEAREGAGEGRGRALARGARDRSFRRRPGVGRESAAQCQGFGRARFGRRARRAREPSSSCALGGGGRRAAHGVARACALRRSLADSTAADRRRGYRGRLSLPRRQPRPAPSDFAARAPGSGRNQHGARAWPNWSRAREFAPQGSSSLGNGLRARQALRS